MQRTPFFISGAGRSGSTYLYHLLRAHPSIAITNEARILDALWRAYQSVALPYGSTTTGGIEGVVDASTLPLLGDVFCAHVLAIMEEYYVRKYGAERRCFGDKLPDYYAVGMAAALAPSIKVLLMVRDPRDVVCSYVAVRGRDTIGRHREAALKNFTVAEIARIWRETYEHLLATAPRLHHVRYVDLVRAPERTVTGVLAHLGLPFDPAIADEIRANATLATHGSSESVESSIGRWRRDLSSADAQTVADICGAMMTRLGLPV